MGARAVSALGVAVLLGVVATSCSSGDSVDLGPDSQADVVVCLDPGLTKDEARVFRESALRGSLLQGAPVADYTAQGADAVTLNWESGATQEERAALESRLRLQPEVASVAENTTVIDECRS